MTSECKSVYQIRVQGRLHEHWSSWFNGLAITSVPAPNGTPITTMVCAVVDQSALHGILETILNLNLPLISVLQMEAEAQAATTDEKGTLMEQVVGGCSVLNPSGAEERK